MSNCFVKPTSRSEGEILQSANLAYRELRAATRNFRPDRVLGEGGFGVVFKGWVDETTFAPPSGDKTGMPIAVKKLNQEGIQGHREWLVSAHYQSIPIHSSLQFSKFLNTLLSNNMFLVSESHVQAEVNYLGQLSHPNLVKLLGYCLEDVQHLLVYEFMPRGSLENHMFRSNY